MKEKWQKLAMTAFLVFAVAFLVTGIVMRAIEKGDLVTVVHHPEAVMGTTASVTAVARGELEESARDALRQAETVLRGVDAKMSTYLTASELSRFNAAPAGETVELSPGTLAVLRAAWRLTKQTDGAFDVTCGPVVDLWRRAARENRLPDEAELAAARELVGWDSILLDEHGATKSIDGVRVDLGGIAKGYAADRAARVIEMAGCAGGLVEVGGDVRCFGQGPSGGTWRVGVRSPFRDGERLAVLALTDAGVCTSGNYRRFSTIRGRRYSHIVDPRTGRPVDFAPSVTVVAPDAMTADAWATALSVLGVDGLRRIPRWRGIEAMIILGTAEKYRIVCTPGFEALLVERPDGEIVSTGPASAPASRASSRPRSQPAADRKGTGDG